MSKNKKEIPCHIVAVLCGVTVSTVRKWHQSGVLVPCGRSAGGRRLYNQDDVMVFKAARDQDVLDKRRASAEKARKTLADHRKTKQDNDVVVLIELQEYLAKVGEAVERLIKSKGGVE